MPDPASTAFTSAALQVAVSLRDTIAGAGSCLIPRVRLSQARLSGWPCRSATGEPEQVHA